MSSSTKRCHTLNMLQPFLKNDSSVHYRTNSLILILHFFSKKKTEKEW